MRKGSNVLWYERRTCAAALCFFAGLLLLAVPAHAKKAGDLLQFTSKGHVLGFSPGSMFLASGDHLLKVDFVGATPVAPMAEGARANDGKAQPLTRVTYPNVWDGVSIVYEGSGRSVVKSTYTVAAGTTTGRIRLKYNRPLTIDERGNLVIRYDRGNMTESVPVAWQVKEGRKKPVMVAYALKSDYEVGFTVGDYDKNLPLTIDPELIWNKSLAKTASKVNALAIDSSGNIYATGDCTHSWGSPVRPFTSGLTDAFVVKFDGSGNLVWNTFLGGMFDDRGDGITLDQNGNVYVTGRSSLPWGSPVRAFTDGFDEGFIAKLDAAGALIWNTFLGGSKWDVAWAIAVDSVGNIYVAGDSGATWGSPIRAYSMGLDGFAAKIDGTGVLVWNTFLGGNGQDHSRGIAVDEDGNIYVAGYSEQTWASPIRAFSGGAYDAFAVKLDNSGALAWNTFLGGNAEDHGNGIALDLNGNIYVVGESLGTWGSPTRAYTAQSDGFAVKLDSSGTLSWNTFLGGSGRDGGNAIAADSSGNLYIAGYSDAAWGSPAREYTGRSDGFAVKLDSSGTLSWNTFLGGISDDYACTIATDPSGDAIYVGGKNGYPWGFETEYTGKAFIALIADPFALTARKTGYGTGTITATPEIACSGTACTAGYLSGTQVSLTATPDPLSSFDGWTGCDSVSGATCNVAVTSNRSVSASFGNLCTYKISPAKVNFGARGGSANVTARAVGSGNCSSPRIDSSDWIQTALSTWKNNRGIVKVTVDAATTSPDRVGGHVSIVDQSVEVSRKGIPCAITGIHPASHIVPVSGESPTFAITMSAEDCAWTASSNKAWITTSSSGAGSGTVAYTVPANGTRRPQTGTVTVTLTGTQKKRFHTVTQRGR